jgi:hypothetical protein
MDSYSRLAGELHISEFRNEKTHQKAKKKYKLRGTTSKLSKMKGSRPA